MSGNLPEFLKEKLMKQYGIELLEQIQKGYLSNRYTTFRANTIKSSAEEISKKLNEKNLKYSIAEWSKEAFIVENILEKEIREFDIYEEGKIYMQSLSSMLPAIILDPKENENILDMTAAPGGKTTQLLALSNNQSFITACEKNKIRMDRLKYNLEKQGATRVNTMNEDARKLDDFFSFDKILLDAPCSGSGTLNINDEKIDKYFTEELIHRSVKTQRELLAKALKILKKGGELVYSTCSILKEENEQNLKQLVETNKVEIIPIDSNIVKSVPTLPVSIEGTLCICPNEYYEGFFVAKMRKK